MRAGTALLLAALFACSSGPRIRVVETAGLDRVHEPVRIEVDGEERYVFVTIGAGESREIPLENAGPAGRLDITLDGPVGFTVANSIFEANHTARTVNEESEDSGTLRALRFKPFEVTLLRTRNRMHWAPSFQREGARGYTSMATWDPVQSVDRRQGPGWFVHTREGSHELYPEIELWAEYRYFAGVPYFLFHAVTKIVEPIEMYWLRGQEMTMDALFTHVVFEGEDGAPAVYDFEARKAVLEENPLAVDIPWVAFVNLDEGYGFGAVVLDYQATTTAGAHTAINDGANDGKYWDRHLVSRQATALGPDDRYEELTAYVLFRASAQQPVGEFLEWERRLRAPLEAELAR